MRKDFTGLRDMVLNKITELELLSDEDGVTKDGSIKSIFIEYYCGIADMLNYLMDSLLNTTNPTYLMIKDEMHLVSQLYRFKGETIEIDRTNDAMRAFLFGNITAGTFYPSAYFKTYFQIDDEGIEYIGIDSPLRHIIEGLILIMQTTELYYNYFITETTLATMTKKGNLRSIAELAGLPLQFNTPPTTSVIVSRSSAVIQPLLDTFSYNGTSYTFLDLPVFNGLIYANAEKIIGINGSDTIVTETKFNFKVNDAVTIRDDSGNSFDTVIHTITECAYYKIYKVKTDGALIGTGRISFTPKYIILRSGVIQAIKKTFEITGLGISNQIIKLNGTVAHELQANTTQNEYVNNKIYIEGYVESDVTSTANSYMVKYSVDGYAYLIFTNKIPHNQVITNCYYYTTAMSNIEEGMTTIDGSTQIEFDRPLETFINTENVRDFLVTGTNWTNKYLVDTGTEIQLELLLKMYYKEVTIEAITTELLSDTTPYLKIEGEINSYSLSRGEKVLLYQLVSSFCATRLGILEV